MNPPDFDDNDVTPEEEVAAEKFLENFDPDYAPASISVTFQCPYDEIEKVAAEIQNWFHGDSHTLILEGLEIRANGEKVELGD